MKILKIEEKTTSSGLAYKKLSVEHDGKEIPGSYWGKKNVNIGDDIELEIEEKNGFTNFKDKKPTYTGGGNREAKTKELMDIKNKNIKDAQYRKELSIAFFNSTNSAIALLAQTPNVQDRQAFIIKYRDWFLAEHKAYRLKELSSMTEESIASTQITIEQKLKNCKSLDDLTRIWSTFTVDEKKQTESLKNSIESKLK